MKKPSPRGIALLLALLLALGAAATVFYNKSRQTVNQTTETNTIITAQKKDVKISLAADGKAVFPVTNLKFNSNGMITKILVQEGQQVKQGDILARLETENLENQVKQAQANYNSAVAKYQKLVAGPSEAERQAKQVAVDNAEKALQVQQAAYDYKLSLLNDGKTTESDILAEESKLEGAKAQLETAKAQLALLTPADPYDLTTADEAVKQMEASLATANKNLREAVLVAPVSGVVAAVNGRVGELVSSSGNPLIVLAGSQEVTVDSYIIEDDIGKISVGQDAEVAFTAIPDTAYEGTVNFISPTPIIDQSGIVTYKVAVTMTAPAEEIKNGMTATVSFIAQQVKGAITVPVEAVVRVNGAPSVEVQHSDGSSEWIKVKAGLTDGKIVEIKEGLQAGDKVIIRKVVSAKQ
ncbi:hypothetical protein JCM15765_24950 [Paradesulfitobacterium aromaticivorans]